MNYDNLTTEELEFMLPLEFQTQIEREWPCGKNCPRYNEPRLVTTTYEQRVWRSDSYNLRGKKSRQYEIIYRSAEWNVCDHSDFHKTARYHSFREALIEMHEKLLSAGIVQEEADNAGK